MRKAHVLLIFLVPAILSSSVFLYAQEQKAAKRLATAMRQGAVTQMREAPQEKIAADSLPPSTAPPTEPPPHACPTAKLDNDTLLGNLMLACVAIYALLITLLGVILQIALQRATPTVLILRRLGPAIGFGLVLMFAQAVCAAPFLRHLTLPAFVIFTINLVYIGILSVYWLGHLDPNKAIDTEVDDYFDA